MKHARTLTQAEAARQLGVSQTAVQKMLVAGRLTAGVREVEAVVADGKFTAEKKRRRAIGGGDA